MVFAVAPQCKASLGVHGSYKLDQERICGITFHTQTEARCTKAGMCSTEACTDQGEAGSASFIHTDTDHNCKTRMNSLVL